MPASRLLRPIATISGRKGRRLFEGGRRLLTSGRHLLSSSFSAKEEESEAQYNSKRYEKYQNQANQARVLRLPISVSSFFEASLIHRQARRVAPYPMYPHQLTSTNELDYQRTRLRRARNANINKERDVFCSTKVLVLCRSQ